MSRQTHTYDARKLPLTLQSIWNTIMVQRGFDWLSDTEKSSCICIEEGQTGGEKYYYEKCKVLIGANLPYYSVSITDGKLDVRKTSKKSFQEVRNTSKGIPIYRAVFCGSDLDWPIIKQTKPFNPQLISVDVSFISPDIDDMYDAAATLEKLYNESVLNREASFVSCKKNKIVACTQDLIDHGAEVDQWLNDIKTTTKVTTRNVFNIIVALSFLSVQMYFEVYFQDQERFGGDHEKEYIAATDEFKAYMLKQAESLKTKINEFIKGINGEKIEEQSHEDKILEDICRVIIASRSDDLRLTPDEITSIQTSVEQEQKRHSYSPDFMKVIVALMIKVGQGDKKSLIDVILDLLEKRYERNLSKRIGALSVDLGTYCGKLSSEKVEQAEKFLHM